MTNVSNGETKRDRSNNSSRQGRLRKADQKWLDEIVPRSKTYPGHLGVMIIRPVPGATSTFTVVIRFDTQDHLHAWMGSNERKRLIEKVKPYLADDDQFLGTKRPRFLVYAGSRQGEAAEALEAVSVIWSAIYPLVLLAFPTVELAFQKLAIPDNRYFRTLIVSASSDR